MVALVRSQQYWARRFEQLTEAQLKKGADLYANLAYQYEKAAASVQKDIEVWYARFAKSEKITMTEAKKLLTTRELKEFRWAVEDYIEKGKTLNYSDKWFRQLENASARFHVSRLEALQMQMQQQAELLHGYELDGMDELAGRIYSDGYYQTAFAIQQGVGVGWDFMKLDANRISKVISKPWAADGANFSERIWKSRTKLVAALNDTLVQSIIRGQSPQKAIDEIKKQFKVSRSRAANLVLTESAFFVSAAQKDAFDALDVEKYEILATLDSHTSEICRSMDGKVLPMEDYKPGVTAPPFHGRCRSCTIPYFEDDIGERAARDGEGKYYTVPSNMSYREWEAQLKEKMMESGKPLHEAMKKTGMLRLPDLDKFLEMKYTASPEHKKLVERYENLTGQREWSAVEFNPETIAKHVKDHGKDFGVTSEKLYEKKALEFVNGDIKKEIDQGIDGVIRMYNEDENTFAAVYQDGTICTFFTPGDKRKYWMKQVEKYGEK